MLCSVDEVNVCVCLVYMKKNRADYIIWCMMVLSLQIVLAFKAKPCFLHRYPIIKEMHMKLPYEKFKNFQGFGS